MITEARFRRPGNFAIDPAAYPFKLFSALLLNLVNSQTFTVDCMYSHRLPYVAVTNLDSVLKAET